MKNLAKNSAKNPAPTIRRVVLLSKIAVVLTGGAMLASCGTHNKNGDPAAAGRSANEASNALNNNKTPTNGGATSPAPGVVPVGAAKAAAEAKTSPSNLDGIWISQCVNAPGGNVNAKSWDKVYLFKGSAWLRLTLYYGDKDCDWDNNHLAADDTLGAGYYTMAPATLAVGQTATIDMIAWGGPGSFGLSDQIGTKAGGWLGGELAQFGDDEFNTVKLTKQPGAANSGQGLFLLGDVTAVSGDGKSAAKRPASPTLEYGMWDGDGQMDSSTP